MKTRVLIIGSCGQIGTELTQKLRTIYGSENVIASDIREGSDELMKSGPFEKVDATNREGVLSVIKKYNVTQVYLMAAMLSATAEKYPIKGWGLNMNSLLIVLELAREKYISKVFWPSSIASYGPTSPKIKTPQHTIMDPETVYGISKLAGEHWCNYYYKKYGVDVRSLRYPGLISWKAKPGGGTTDYAVEIYFKAIKEKKYECFLGEDTNLPMMYMEDAIEATIQLMQAESRKIVIRSSYNIAAISFTPKEIAIEIKKHIPNFEITYKPDFRQEIADSWPQVIDDAHARKDWNWRHKFDLASMTTEMLENIKTIM